MISVLFAFSMQAHMVRVLLSDNVADEWIISAKKRLILRDKKTEKVCATDTHFCKASFGLHKDTMTINGKKMSSKSFWIEPSEGNLVFNGNTYDGVFCVIKQKNKWLLINELDIEEYIYSVVKTESWPGWPLEAHKVMAIACRSYLLNQLLASDAKNAPFHIRNTNRHQTYQGMHKSDSIRQAVQETKGVFIAYKKKPILAMFDACCGSVIPARTIGLVNFDKAPYLARDYSCTYCQNTKIFEWKATCSIDQLATMLQDFYDCAKHPISEVKIAKRDDGGVVQRVSVKTKKGKFFVKAKEFYGSVKGVKSYCFSLFKKDKVVTIEGKGHGHHMGLCQWGAREMVRLGWDYEAIIDFYYPGTHLMKLVGTKKIV